MIGTHNSTTDEIDNLFSFFLKDIVQNQTCDIKTQYEMGVRYFDIKISYEHKTNMMYTSNIFPCHKFYRIIQILNGFEKKCIVDIKRDPKHIDSFKIDIFLTYLSKFRSTHDILFEDYLFENIEHVELYPNFKKDFLISKQIDSENVDYIVDELKEIIASSDDEWKKINIYAEQQSKSVIMNYSFLYGAVICGIFTIIFFLIYKISFRKGIVTPSKKKIFLVLSLLFLFLAIIAIICYFIFSWPKRLSSLTDQIFDKLVKSNVKFKPSHIIVFDFIDDRKIAKLNKYLI